MGLLILIYILIYFAPLIVGWAFMGIQKKIKFVHSESGINNNGFIGYSWTYFFFDIFYTFYLLLNPNLILFWRGYSTFHYRLISIRS